MFLTSWWTSSLYLGHFLLAKIFEWLLTRFCVWLNRVLNQITKEARTDQLKRFAHPLNLRMNRIKINLIWHPWVVEATISTHVNNFVCMNSAYHVERNIFCFCYITRTCRCRQPQSPTLGIHSSSRSPCSPAGCTWTCTGACGRGPWRCVSAAGSSSTLCSPFHHRLRRSRRLRLGPLLTYWCGSLRSSRPTTDVSSHYLIRKDRGSSVHHFSL